MAKTKSNGAAAAPAEMPREALVIPRNACHLDEAKRNTWEVELPIGATPEGLLARDSLGTIARDMVLKDLVYAQPRDGAWMAVYRVIGLDPGLVQLALLQKFDLPQRAEGDHLPDPPGFAIRTDDVRGWYVERLADGVILGSQSENPQLSSREMVRRFLFDHATLRAGQS